MPDEIAFKNKKDSSRKYFFDHVSSIKTFFYFVTHATQLGTCFNTADCQGSGTSIRSAKGSFLTLFWIFKYSTTRDEENSKISLWAGISSRPIV